MLQKVQRVRADVDCRCVRVIILIKLAVEL